MFDWDMIAGFAAESSIKMIKIFILYNFVFESTYINLDFFDLKIVKFKNFLN